MNFTEKLGGLLPDGIDCFLVTSELNQRYLTGLNYTDGYVIVSREKSWLLADFRYIEVAKRYETDTLEVVQLENRKVNLGNIFADNKFSKVGFESNNMTVARLNGLKETFPLVDFVPVGGIIEKMRESIASVLPITLIVAALCLFLIPVSSGLMLSFLIGSVMIILGMGLFTVGSDLSMTQIGTHIGAQMTRSKKLVVILILSFVLGVIITIAEPDLQVLAKNVPEIDTTVLIVTVSVGVGLFLTISMLRILFRIPLKWLLVFFYAVIFALAAFSDQNFLSVAFDSGGVASGPMTSTFLLPLSIGVCGALGGNLMTDAFGVVALVALTPLIAIQLMGLVYKLKTGKRTSTGTAGIADDCDAIVDLEEGE